MFKKKNIFLAVDPLKKEEVIKNYSEFAELTSTGISNKDISASENNWMRTPKEFVKIENKVATIPVYGALYNKSDIFTWYYDLTTYEELSEAMDYSLEEGVKKIIFDIDSPGGLVAGVEKLAKKISNLGIETEAMVDYAASAAYLLASQTNKIITTGKWVEVGSIGIISVIADFSKAYEQMGIKNLVFTSKKAPNKFINPNTERGAKQIQNRLDEYHELFTDLISEGRNVDKEYIDNNFGKGATLMAEKAIKFNMIDEVFQENKENHLKDNKTKSYNKNTSKMEESMTENFTKKETETSIKKDLNSDLLAERKRVIALSGWAKSGTAEQRKIALEAIENGKTQDEVLAALIAAQRSADSESKTEAKNLEKENPENIAIVNTKKEAKIEAERKAFIDEIIAGVESGGIY